jgi:hypothetical protein
VLQPPREYSVCSWIDDQVLKITVAEIQGDWMLIDVFLRFGREAVTRSDEDVAITQGDKGILRASQRQHCLKHRLQVAGDWPMTRSTSEVAVCCSRTSASSRASRATLVSRQTAAEAR